MTGIVKTLLKRERKKQKRMKRTDLYGANHDQGEMNQPWRISWKKRRKKKVNQKDSTVSLGTIQNLPSNTFVPLTLLHNARPRISDHI